MSTERPDQRTRPIGLPLDRRLSLPVLHLIGHAPLIVFAVGVTIVTAILLPLLGQQSEGLARALDANESGRRAIFAFTEGFKSTWSWCLGGFYVASALGSAIVAWTHRALSSRLRRIVVHAERIGSGSSDVALVAEADDVLGKLESALAQVGHELGSREVARRTEAEHREQLARIQRAMTMVDSEEDALRVVGRALFTLVRGTSAELLMSDSGSALLSRVAQSSTAPPPGCATSSLGGCPAVHHGSTLQFPDSEVLDACPRLHERSAPCSAVCVPVVVMGRSQGVLHAIRTPGTAFLPGTVQALETLAAVLGTRLGVSRALGSAQQQAETDALTGLLNRRSLESKAAQLLASSQRVVVVMADLDHFKRLNDSHGHAAGDQALRVFAQVLKATLRPGDVVARYGGEEFTILLADCSTEEAVGALDRVRAVLRQRCQTGDGPVFTASFGASEFPEHGQDFESLTAAADRALYLSKDRGRDRVTVAALEDLARSSASAQRGHR